MYKKHFSLILAVLCLAVVGCRNPQNTETGAAEEIAPVVSNTETIAPADNAARIAELENNARLLEEQIAQKDAEIAELENRLVSERETSQYVQAYADRADKNKRNILFVTLISILLNLILGWFLYRAKKMPKRLALPEGRNDKRKGSDNAPSDRPSPEMQKKSAGEDPYESKADESATPVKSDVTIKKTEEPKKRRGRPKKNGADIPPQNP